MDAMAFIDQLIGSGRVVDLILAVLALELVLAFAARKQLHTLTRGRLSPVQLLVGALPGAAILLALRSALTGGPWQAIAGWLAVSFVLHLADLAARARA